MEVGTAEPIKETKKKKRKKRADLSRWKNAGSKSGDGGDDDSGGGGKGGGGNGGNNFPKNKIPEETAPEPTNKSRILMIFLLSVVIMTFGGLIGAYVFLATNKAAEWNPLERLPTQVWISTFIILASSLTYHFGKSYLFKEKHEQKARKWFLITAGLGGLFISSQLIVWMGLVNRGLYMRGNPYVGFFYILTAVHVIHVLGGIIALGYILLRSWNRTRSTREVEKRKNDATAIGWYWHTMDGLWLVLLFLLGFFK